MLVREDQYLYVARRTFRNLFLRAIYLDNEARSFKNEMLPEKAYISLLKISICTVGAKKFGRFVFFL